MRRAAVVISIVVASVAIGALVVVSRGSPTPRRVVAAGAVVTTVPELWSVPTSSSDAIAAVQKLTAEVDPSSTLSARLLTYGDVRKAAAPDSTNAIADTKQVWAVEAIGKVTPEFARGETFSWAILIVDAQNGSVIGTFAKLNSSVPAFWDSLPDHSSQS